MQGEPIVILLVEDDPAHAEIVKRNLEISRIANTLIHVSDGQAALDYLYHRDVYSDPGSFPRPGMVLLDLRLPKVDGLQVLTIIKNDPGLKQIPVIILTTSDIESDVARAYDSHANSYLLKPLDFTRFSELLDSLGYYWMMWNKHPST